MTIKSAVLAGLIVAGWLTVGEMAFQDAQDHAERYCAMVQANAWPDYDKHIQCKERGK